MTYEQIILIIEIILFGLFSLFIFMYPTLHRLSLKFLLKIEITKKEYKEMRKRLYKLRLQNYEKIIKEIRGQD